ncbi:uncharacterized protein [Symphalangus syndactylus]|uniref:uncharacterized protein n=1 Tax=Symphalangus syndactylus TaxID=9590 RepID=UPI0024433B1D|nr:uncharacterized protein LOC129491142 [Symphalangus syndactylus]
MTSLCQPQLPWATLPRRPVPGFGVPTHKLLSRAARVRSNAGAPGARAATSPALSALTCRPGSATALGPRPAAPAGSGRPAGRPAVLLRARASWPSRPPSAARRPPGPRPLPSCPAQPPSTPDPEVPSPLAPGLPALKAQAPFVWASPSPSPEAGAESPTPLPSSGHEAAAQVTWEMGKSCESWLTL